LLPSAEKGGRKPNLLKSLKKGGGERRKPLPLRTKGKRKRKRQKGSTLSWKQPTKGRKRKKKNSLGKGEDLFS